MGESDRSIKAGTHAEAWSREVVSSILDPILVQRRSGAEKTD